MSSQGQGVVDFIPQLRSYARSLTRKTEAADDLVQDCLQRALENLHRWEPGTNMRAWLFTIMHNLHVSKKRRRDQDPRFVTPEFNDEYYPAPSGTDAVGDIRDLESALDALSPEQREIIHLVAAEELSYAEVAAVLGVPLGTVMSRLHRAREQLRALMFGESQSNIRRVK